ncbi:hypothetical protein KIN_12600 [Litoreibacter roseus]|uniref:Uncharacterized protein n=1 Tax=Litoreibacter roseus TaxID=2601869 RepID=A0A6N6JDD0_9RHOB|nr:hypothetical protein KIN_12600 [Litoreibacter roseus]
MAPPMAVNVQRSDKWVRVKVKAVDIKTPWRTRRIVKVVRSCVTPSRAVGMDNSARLIQMPAARLIRFANAATNRLAAAMPMVLALTAKPITDALTL